MHSLRCARFIIPVFSSAQDEIMQFDTSSLIRNKQLKYSTDYEEALIKRHFNGNSNPFDLLMVIGNDDDSIYMQRS